MYFRLYVESFKLDMINLACGVIRTSIKCSYVEIFDQQESFKLDMIDLACGVIRISFKCSCLEIFDQQGNLNLIPLVVDSFVFDIFMGILFTSSLKNATSYHTWYEQISIFFFLKVLLTL